MAWVGSGPDVDLPQGCECGGCGRRAPGRYYGYQEASLVAELRRPAAGQA